jgi:hypothetical protein
VSLAVESFLVVSAATESVLGESILAESALAESAAEDEPEPLQAANEVAIARATKPNLNEFFMFTFLMSDLIVFLLIH